MPNNPGTGIQTTPDDPFGSVIHDIPRTHTRCKIWVYSHVDKLPVPTYKDELAGQINCSQDVIQCDTSKTIKSGGQASFVLVPRRNYLNMIFPNDWVNIYFDLGDGRGWIRTFLGFVDRVHRQISTDPNTGATTTRFRIACTDVTKALQKINIYFNPHLTAKRRPDLIGDFAGTANLGGYALRNKGVAMHGSPADLVMSLLHLTLGMGGQFMLPKSYPLDEVWKQKNRAARWKWALNNLDLNVISTIQSQTLTGRLTPEALVGWQKVVEAEAEFDAKSKISNKLTKKLSAKQVFGLTDAFGFPRDPSGSEIYAAEKSILEGDSINSLLFSTGSWRAAVEVAKSISAGSPSHFLDLLNFDMFENQMMDGYVTSQSITWTEGSVWQIINSWANGDWNELFLDLRPVSVPPSKGSAASKGKDASEVGGIQSYLKGPDETNFDFKEDGSAATVAFTPHVVMREYPFSTVGTINPPESVKVLDKEVGLIQFGAIFSNEPNRPGRHWIKLPALNQTLVEKYKNNIKKIPKFEKYLDVAVISVKDITAEQIGRSDHDHVNLIEVYSDITSGVVNFQRFITQDIQPIVSAIGIARHGIRVRKYTTKFGRFASSKNARGGAVDSAPNRRLLVRWAMILDHWYQHAIEYFNGTMNTRGFPEIRVGFRLDIRERRESYYIEGVNHAWTFPGPLTTAFTVSRGQRNDPYPIYVLPSTKGFNGWRKTGSRLEEFFLSKNPSAVQRTQLLHGSPQIINENVIDDPDLSTSLWTVGDFQDDRSSHIGYMKADSSDFVADLDAIEEGARRVGIAIDDKVIARQFGYLQDTKDKGSTSGGKL